MSQPKSRADSCKTDSMGRRVNPDSHRHLLKHGGWSLHRPTYQCWLDMKQRCYNERHKQFRNYGARGIAVCERWLDDFSAFMQDMGEKPDGLTLDRIDNNAGYEPSNCRWATKAEQRANQRGVCLLPVDGKLVPRDVAARMLGIHPATLQYRINQGWPLAEALKMPPKRRAAMKASHD